MNICIKKAKVQINNSLAMEDLLFFVRILPVIIESSTIFWWNAWHNWCHYFCWQHHHATQYQLQLEDCWALVVKLKIRAKWKNHFFFWNCRQVFLHRLNSKENGSVTFNNFFRSFSLDISWKHSIFIPDFQLLNTKPPYNWIANSALHTCL